MDIPTVQVLGIHILDWRSIRDYVYALRQFDQSLTMQDRKNLRLFFDRHRGNLFWKPKYNVYGCSKSIRGYCVCVCPSLTETMTVVLKNLIEIFWDRGRVMNSHHERVSFVTYMNKYGSNIFDDLN